MKHRFTNLKFTYTLCILFLTSIVNAQLSTIFSESIGTVASTTTLANHETNNGFDNDNLTMSGTGDVRTSTASTGYTGSSGSANVFLTNTSGLFFQISGISSNGFSNLNLSFGAYKSTTASSMSELKLEYSTDGLAYNVITIPAQTTGSGTANWRLISINLPLNLSNQSNLIFKWTNLGGGAQIRLDDIQLKGCPQINFTLQPSQTNLSKCENTLTDTLKVASSQTGLSYQWYYNSTNTTVGGTLILGAINSYLVPNQTGINYYYCEVSNQCSSLLSNLSGEITVNPAPIITPLNNISICANDTTQLISFTSSIQNTNYSWTNSETTIGLASSGNGDIAPLIVLNNDTIAKAAIVSVVGTSVNTCVSAAVDFTITVNPVPFLQNVITNLTLCQLQTAYFPPFQVVPSTSVINWTNNNPLIGLAANGQGNIPPFFIQSAPGGIIGSLITVTPTFAGCNGDFRVISLIANPIPIINQVTNQTLCSGDQTNTINFTVIPNDAIINWTNTEPGIGLAINGNGDISSFTTTNSGNSALVGYINAHAITVNNCIGPDEYFSITVNPNPNTIILSSTDESCNQSNGSISVSGANGGTSPYIYSFNGQAGTNSPNFTNLPAGNYTLTVQDANNCYKDSVVVLINLNAVTPATPSICLVTVDDLSTHNIIFWDKSNNAVGDTFIVYREISLNNYAPVGRIPFDSMSLFADTNRVMYSLGNGDPNLKSWRYKLSVKNNCNIESNLSPFHQTMYFNQNNDYFSWSQYQIEGSPTPIPQLNGFTCVRDNNSTNNWAPVLTVGPNDTSYVDPDFSLFSNTGSWRTNTNWTIQCTPTLRFDGNNETQTTVVKSKSNIRNNRTVGVKHQLTTTSTIQVYPNPSNDKFHVKCNSHNLIINAEVISSKGDVVLKTTIDKNNSVIDLSSFEKGVYYLKLNTINTTEVVKLIKM
jgi:hypothetical protein